MRIPDYQHNWDENIHDCLGIKEEFSNTSQDIKFWPREEPQSIGETQDQGRYGCCWAYTVAGVIRFALYKLGKDGKKFCGVSLYELLVRVLPLFPRSLPSWGNFTFQAWSVIMVFGLYSSSPEKSFDPLWDYPNDGDLKFYPGVVKNENSIRPTPSTLDPDNTNFRAKAIDALEKGPISGSFHACANKFRQNWHQKSGAVYSERVGRRATQRRLYTRDEIIIHSVLIVGYGIRNGEQYFIIQNSWGTTLGFGGFARISMDCFIRFQSIEDYKIKPLTSSDEWLKEWFMTCAEKHGLSHSTWCPSSLLWDCVEVGDGVEEATMPNTLQIMNLIPKESDGEKFEDAVARVRRCVGGGTATEAADSDSDLEVVADCIPVNLRCPMSGSRMKVAGRFKPCVHMGCFDLEVFVEMNMRSRKWHCPVCLKNCCLDNIIIDPYFNRITAKLRSLSVVLMGKNTMIKRSIRVHAEKSGNDTILNLIPLLVGNVGLIFTKGDLKEVSEEVAKYKVGAPARVGLVAPDDVVVPPGNTGLDPSQTSFFQVLNIPTKINKGTVEIITPVELIRKGDKVGSSEAALLAKLGIRPFSYGLEVAKVYDNGSVFSPEVLDLTDEDLMGKFALGVSMATSLALAVSYPTLIAAPHMFINACKNLLAIAVETEYSFPQADKVKEFLEDPSKFAVAAAPAASGGAAPAAAAAKEPEKEEPAEESDDDMGFGLFD